jgi:hypothetical protein
LEKKNNNNNDYSRVDSNDATYQSVRDSIASIQEQYNESNKQVVATNKVYNDYTMTFDKTSYRYQLREIKRRITQSTMKIDGIKWVTFDASGNTAVDADGKIIYQNFNTPETALKLYGSDGLQDYYLSPCYSKNYPFYVDVIFEQIQ